MSGINHLSKVVEVRNEAGILVGTVTTTYRTHILGVGFAGFDDPELARQHILRVSGERFTPVVPEPEEAYLPVVAPVAAPAVVNLKHLDTMTRKRVTAEERINKKVKYLDEFPELGLKSIKPHQIVAAAFLLAYNVKTRKLAYYVANWGDCLKIKGSTLLNFDPNKSGQKTIRKPAIVLPYVVSSHKTDAIKAYEETNAVASPLTGRINKDTILLRVH